MFMVETTDNSEDSSNNDTTIGIEYYQVIDTAIAIPLDIDLCTSDQPSALIHQCPCWFEQVSAPTLVLDIVVAPVKYL